MVIKSNELKEVPYPNDFNDDDKLEYDRLDAEAKVYHSDVYENEHWIIHLAIIAHIRSKKGVAFPVTDEELNALKDRYSVNVKEVTCNGDEIPYLYDKQNNPIFKPNEALFEVNSNVVSTEFIADRVEIYSSNILDNNIKNE